MKLSAGDQRRSEKLKTIPKPWGREQTEFQGAEAGRVTLIEILPGARLSFRHHERKSECVVPV